MGVEILPGVPEILMEGDFPFPVEAHLADAHRVHRLSAAQRRRGEDHRPAHVVIIAGARHVVDRHLIARHGLAGLDEIRLDLGRAVMKRQRVVETGVRRIDLKRVFTDVFHVADALEKRLEALNRRLFPRTASLKTAGRELLQPALVGGHVFGGAVRIGAGIQQQEDPGHGHEQARHKGGNRVGE